MAAVPQTTTSGFPINAGLLCASQLADTGLTTVYTAPAARMVAIATCTITNTSSAGITVNVYLVPSGRTADATCAICWQYPLDAGDSFSLKDDIADVVLGPLDSVVVQASAAAAATVVMSGRGTY